MADNDDKITLTIDGQEVSVPKGTTVLEAAKSIGIEIPTFCWHPKLKSVGACRMCYVEVEKRPKLEVSCATEALPGMVVHTQSEKVLQGRKAVLEFILMNHPLDCPTCDKGGECDLQDLTFAHGIDNSRFDFDKYRFIRDKKSTFDDWRLGPEIVRNQNRCILCYRCVRSNKEIFGQFDLGAFQRGNMTEIDAAPGRKVESIYSGNLVEICPVGALTNTDWRYKIRVWKTDTVDSICQYCADGCNIKFWKGRGQIFRTTSRRNDAIDEGWLCDVGRYGYQVANNESRLKNPLIKKGDSQVPATWEEAVQLIAQRFKEIKDQKGGVCIGGMVSPNLDTSSLYAVSKFFRTVLNTNNVDFRSDYKMLPEEPGDMYSRMTSLPFRIADIEKSDVILVVGSNLIKEHPITNLRVRKAVTKLGAKLYAINPFATKSADISTDEIIYNSGTLDALLNGICLSVVEQGLSSGDINADKLKGLISPDSLEEISKLTGISKDRINSIAKAIANAKHITIISGELTALTSTRETVSAAISNLANLTGLLQRGQIGFLAKAANSKGAELVGAIPYPSETQIEKMKEMWGSYPDNVGVACDKMILNASKEEIDSFLVMGANPVTTYPDGEFIKKGLEKLDFLVVADLYETETTAMADVVLPLASWAEMDGSFVNLEGRVQEFKQALKRFGSARPGYEIIKAIAQELKADIYETVEQLDNEGLQLLKLHQPQELPKELLEVKYIPPDTREDYPYTLFVVDETHHFGHLTEKSKSLTAFCNEAQIEIAPSIAGELHVENGDMLRIESEIGKVVLPVRISEHIDNNVILATRNFSATPVNILQMRKRRVDRVKLSRVEEK